MAGFECSCHRRRDGRRLDLAVSSGHERWAALDYARLRALGVATVREGISWHRCERPDGRIDLSPLRPRLAAARDAGMQVIWDLCHYGWPDGLDIFRPEFVDRFAAWARAVAELVAEESDEIPFYVPVNEISFWSWAGGEVGFMNPCTAGRGFELKAQLVRAALAATEAVRSVDPRARVLYVDPIIHIEADPERPEEGDDAHGHRLAQWEAGEMLSGRRWPQLGGDERYLDLIGVNYYPNNQWILNGPTIERGSPLYRPPRDLLREAYERYRRPLVLTETGGMGDNRGPWLAHIGEEVRAALADGIPVLGICLYPILDYPAWDDDHRCPVGMWGYADGSGQREIHRPLAEELARQERLFAARSNETRLATAGPAGTTCDTSCEEMELATF